MTMEVALLSSEISNIIIYMSKMSHLGCADEMALQTEGTGKLAGSLGHFHGNIWNTIDSFEKKTLLQEWAG